MCENGKGNWWKIESKVLYSWTWELNQIPVQRENTEQCLRPNSKSLTQTANRAMKLNKQKITKLGYHSLSSSERFYLHFSPSLGIVNYNSHIYWNDW